jgi:hypothetical protein
MIFRDRKMDGFVLGWRRNGEGRQKLHANLAFLGVSPKFSGTVCAGEKRKPSFVTKSLQIIILSECL